MLREKQKYAEVPLLWTSADLGAGDTRLAQAVGRRERNTGLQAGEALEILNSREEVQLHCRRLEWSGEGVELTAKSAALLPSGLATAEPGTVVVCLAMV